MLIYAVAALALGLPAKKQTSYIVPIYDLVPAVDASGNLTVNFMLASAWNSAINSPANFSFWFANGNTSAFSPNGNWTQISPQSYTPISGSQVTVSFNSNQFNGNSPTGTIWVMYNASANESSDGAEYTVAGVPVGGNSQPGHGGRPGSIVPINDVVPTSSLAGQNHSVQINFYVNQPLINITPTFGFWMNTGQGNSPYPGNGWQTMNYSNLNAPPGTRAVSAVGNPNANAGYYCVGASQTYSVVEPYNPNNSSYTEFSAIIRAFSGA